MRPSSLFILCAIAGGGCWPVVHFPLPYRSSYDPKKEAKEQAEQEDKARGILADPEYRVARQEWVDANGALVRVAERLEEARVRAGGQPLSCSRVGPPLDPEATRLLEETVKIR